MLSTSINIPSKLNNASDLEISPSVSTRSTEAPPCRGKSSENIAEHEDRYREFEELDAELADCEGEASLPVAGLSASRAGIPKVPEYAHFIVRNTFLDELVARPKCLEGFFSERHMNSFPETRQHTADNDDPLACLKHDDDSRSDEEGKFNTGSPRCTRESLTAIDVRNTFINVLVGRSESLEGFFRERRVKSCPNTERAFDSSVATTEQPARSRILDPAEPEVRETLRNDAEQAFMAMTPAPFKIGTTLPAPLDIVWVDDDMQALPVVCNEKSSIDHGQIQDRFRQVPDKSWTDPGQPVVWVDDDMQEQWASAACATAENAAVSGVQDPRGTGPGMQGVLPPPPADWAPTAFQFGISKLPPPPTAAELGSPEMPTVGSLLHSSGKCEPCGFAHTKGCANGARCAFCHLCEPGEVKRRKREKREKLQQAREAARLTAEAAQENSDITESSCSGMQRGLRLEHPAGPHKEVQSGRWLF